MSWRRAARIGAWIAGSAAVAGAVGLTSFCVAFRADRRSSVLEVPDWSGKPRADAAEEAAALGLGFEVGEERHDPAVSPGRVLSQEPAAKTSVRRGRVIRVVVSLGGETLSVPTVVGTPARQADLEIRRQGLSSGFETRVHDASVPAGKVMDQFPAAGALATSGERVDRLVSDGERPKVWIMPDLRGRSLRAAQEWITLCGFRSGAVAREPAADREPGTVLRQRPLPGWPVAKSDTVQLTVAN
ncbi:MAG TPA: PASTA domain-containing protein [Candidatus Polarisedimenticolaceae bacterium]|nr:PASTA domain-containing protein [Candidatus Polarisedimenticolaceae bacterium]